MKIFYTVTKTGVVEVPNSDWDEFCHEYTNDKEAFAFATVEGETGEAITDITIDNIDMDQ